MCTTDRTLALTLLCLSDKIMDEYDEYLLQLAVREEVPGRLGPVGVLR